jgi:hypothetical protein
MRKAPSFGNITRRGVHVADFILINACAHAAWHIIRFSVSDVFQRAKPAQSEPGIDVVRLEGFYVDGATRQNFQKQTP